MNALTLTTFNGEPRADSRVIAERLGVEHKATYQMVRHYCADFERFGLLRFETGAIQGRRGPEKFALLNEEQCYRLLTYFDYTLAVSQLRRGLVLAFGKQRRGAPPACQEQRPPDLESTAPVPFSFESRALRFIPNGDSFLVVAKDVAEALEYARFDSNLLLNVPDEWKGTNPIRTPSGVQEMWCLSEQGFYFFVNRSDKPKALPLQKWVAGEVLPSIRQTGSYSLPGAVPPANPPNRLSAEMKKRINRRAQRLTPIAFKAYASRMREVARYNPDTFIPERWTPSAYLLEPKPYLLPQPDQDAQP
jgi:prophage antirepressor-like protein